MTTAAELREALEIYDLRFVEGWKDAYRVSNMRLADAARTIALPILEADPELVERLMAVLPRDPYNKDQDRSKRILAEKILAAISTPTSVEES